MSDDPKNHRPMLISRDMHANSIKTISTKVLWNLIFIFELGFQQVEHRWRLQIINRKTSTHTEIHLKNSYINRDLLRKCSIISLCGVWFILENIPYIFILHTNCIGILICLSEKIWFLAFFFVDAMAVSDLPARIQTLISVYNCFFPKSWQWRNNGPDGVSNHQPNTCLLGRLFRPRSRKTSKLCVTGIFAGNSPMTKGH